MKGRMRSDDSLIVYHHELMRLRVVPSLFLQVILVPQSAADGAAISKLFRDLRPFHPTAAKFDDGLVFGGRPLELFRPCTLVGVGGMRTRGVVNGRVKN